MKLLSFLQVLSLFCLACSQDRPCEFNAYIPTGTKNYVNAPAFPYGRYEPGSSCTWWARTDPGSRIRIVCDPIDIPRKGSGCLDALVVSSRDDQSDRRFFCGTNSFTFVGEGQNLRLGFYSATWSPGGRFSCTFIAEIDEHQPSCDCGWSFQMRIVGGNETKINEFPMMAGLISAVTRIITCGATIISDHHVLTAAHCLTALKPDTTGVLVGEHDITTGRDTNATQLLRVRRFILNPDYDAKTSRNDIGIVEVVGTFQFGLRVGPACLPFKRWDYTGQSLTALGWGTIEFGGPTSDRLMKASLTAVPISQCVAAFGNQVDVNRQICTFTPGKDACQFDSGGPLIWFNKDNNRYFIAGIISYGKICGLDTPGVNTAVYPYLDWIRQQTPGVNYCVK